VKRVHEWLEMNHFVLAENEPRRFGGLVVIGSSPTLPLVSVGGSLSKRYSEELHGSPIVKWTIFPPPKFSTFQGDQNEVVSSDAR